MSAHLDVVRRYYELVDAGDVPGLVALYADDATYDRPGYPPLHGHAELTAFFGGTRVIASGRHTVEAEVVDGTAVAVHGRFEGLLKDGTPTSLRFADFFTFDSGGRIATRRSFFFTPLV